MEILLEAGRLLPLKGGHEIITGHQRPSPTMTIYDFALRLD